MHKRAQGGDFLSIGYFIFLIFLIGATIFLMSKLVLNSTYDARMTDASLLGYRISECLSEKEVTEADMGNIERTCGITLRNSDNEPRRFVLHISADGKELFKHGDAISCDLYNLNTKNARCVTILAQGTLNGKDADFKIIAGSNLENEGVSE